MSSQKYYGDATYCQECGANLTTEKILEENKSSFIRKIPGFRSNKPWKMLTSSIIYLAVLIMIIGLASSGFGNNIPVNNTTIGNNTYDANNVTFVYPLDFNIDNLTANDTNNDLILSVSDMNTTTLIVTNSTTNTTTTSTSESGSTFFVAKKTSKIGTNEMNSQIDAIIANPTNNPYFTSNVKNVTAQKIIVDNENASELTSQCTDDQGATWKEIDIVFQKNGYIYILTYHTTPATSFNETEYQMIINTFQVK